MSENILRDICKNGDIKWTLHALNRIRERKIVSSTVINTIIHGVVVVHYDDDNPFPSWLMYNGDKNAPLHVVASTDGEKIHIITTYIPSLDEWEDDFKTRKENG